MSSLRLRLIAPLVVGLVLLLGAAGMLLYQAVYGTLRDGFDQALVEKARTLAARLELVIEAELRVEVERLGAAALDALDQGAGGAEDRDARDALLSLAPKAFRIRFSEEAATPADVGPRYRIQDMQGRTVAVSPSLDPTELDLPPAGFSSPRLEDHALPGGRPGRIAALRVDEVTFRDDAWSRVWARIRGSDEVASLRAVVVVAEDREDLHAFLATMRWALIACGLLVATGTAVVVQRVVGRGLAPLDDLRRQIAALDASTLDRRIQLANAPTELADVVDGLNETLEALEGAFRRERRTTANIAHELRTPIAELRSLTDVALQWPDDETLQNQCVEQGHEVALHMSRIVSALLEAARAEAGASTTAPERLDVEDLVHAAWPRLESAARERRAVLDTNLEHGLAALAHREAVETILVNLLQNAVQHAPEGSTICVAASREAGRVLLEISNPCTDLVADDLVHLTEPFWRKDPGRLPSTQGGLGLPLVAELARAAHVELAFDLRDGTFVVRLAFLPAAEA